MAFSAFTTTPSILTQTVGGPVIDKNAQATLLKHIDTMKHTARLFYQAPLGSECDDGIFVAPTLLEIGSISELKREVFGPVIHVIRFSGEELDKVIDEINSSGLSYKTYF